MQQQSRDVFGHYRWRHNCARTRDSYSVQLWSVNSSGRRHGVSFQATPTASWRTCHRNENRHSRAWQQAWRSAVVRTDPGTRAVYTLYRILQYPNSIRASANPITATRAFRLVFEAQVIADVVRYVRHDRSTSSSTISFAPVSVSRRGPAHRVDTVAHLHLVAGKDLFAGAVHAVSAMPSSVEFTFSPIRMSSSRVGLLLRGRADRPWERRGAAGAHSVRATVCGHEG